MGYLKGKSSLMIYEKYPELRYKYRNENFGAEAIMLMRQERMQRK